MVPWVAICVSGFSFFEFWHVLCSNARTWLSWQHISLYWIALASFCQALISHNNGFWVIAFLLFPIFLWLWKSLNLCRVWNEGHSPETRSPTRSSDLGNDLLSVLHSLSLKAHRLPRCLSLFSLPFPWMHTEPEFERWSSGMSSLCCC